MLTCIHNRKKGLALAVCFFCAAENTHTIRPGPLAFSLYISFGLLFIWPHACIYCLICSLIGTRSGFPPQKKKQNKPCPWYHPKLTKCMQSQGNYNAWKSAQCIKYLWWRIVLAIFSGSMTAYKVRGPWRGMRNDSCVKQQTIVVLQVDSRDNNGKNLRNLRAPFWLTFMH